MDTALLIELFGYLGSVLVVVSMLMSSVVKLRIINTIGSVISGTYALISGAMPLVLMNGALIVINVYNLFKLLKTEQKYDMFKVKADDSFVAYFLNRYLADIQTYFPSFKADNGSDVAFVVCCEGNPAGILMGKDLGDGTIDVVLDYSVPTYRDCSVGDFLYGKLAVQGIMKLTYSQEKTEAHAGYLTKMGFIENNGTFTKKLG